MTASLVSTAATREMAAKVLIVLQQEAAQRYRQLRRAKVSTWDGATAPGVSHYELDRGMRLAVRCDYRDSFSYRLLRGDHGTTVLTEGEAERFIEALLLPWRWEDQP